MGAEAVFRLGSGAGFLPAASSNSLLRSFASLLAAAPTPVSDLENERMYVALILGIMVLTNVTLHAFYMKRRSPLSLAKLKTWTITYVYDNQGTADAWECDTGPPTCVESAPEYPSQGP